MKRQKFLKLLKRNGWYLLRNGASHDIYTDGTSIEPVPRHAELNEMLAEAIIKRRNLK
ncbi:MAG: type II toxin-antitoxin system HicA family toxin [Peptococcaceae bacterium]|nr:type II toxin-antitoxin system HicA family toxin [Peptococcaceae bacterium]